MKNIDKLLKFGEKYGFEICDYKSDNMYIVAKDTRGKAADWIKINKDTGMVTLLGNTDQCNIWFCDTKSHLLPDDCIQLVEDLNVALELRNDDRFKVKELIDPEDWQVIASVYDAYEDARYNC